MFYYFGIGINFFLLLILISKKGKTLADKILALWLLVIALHTISYVITLQPTTIDNIHWVLAVGTPFPLLHGPFLYLYTAASTNMLSLRKKSMWLHFIPAIVTVIYLLPIYLMNAQQKMDVYLYRGQDYRVANIVLLILLQLSGLVYVIWSFFLLRKHKQNIGEQFSYEERINLNWLRYLIYSILVVWGIIIFLKKNSLIFGAGVVFVTLLGFLGIRQVGIFGRTQLSTSDGFKQEDVPVDETEQMEQEPEQKIDLSDETLVVDKLTLTDKEEIIQPKKKYANSGLTNEMAVKLHERLKQIMDTEKLYTEPELSLIMLATRLNVHSNYLSQIINEKEGRSFFDYINNLRVEEFKRLVALPANKQFTILSLAYECGFNSKSSFNKNFKKVMGQSPTEFLASHAKKM